MKSFSSIKSLPAIILISHCTAIVFFFLISIKDSSELLKTGTSHHRMCKQNRCQSQTFPQSHDDKQLPHQTPHQRGSGTRDLMINPPEVLQKVTGISELYEL